MEEIKSVSVFLKPQVPVTVMVLHPQGAFPGGIPEAIIIWNSLGQFAKIRALISPAVEAGAHRKDGASQGTVPGQNR